VIFGPECVGQLRTSLHTTHEMCVLRCVKLSRTYYACRITGGECLHGLVDQHHLSPNLAMVCGENDLGMMVWLWCMERRGKRNC
jgi:hypothetical protein